EALPPLDAEDADVSIPEARDGRIKHGVSPGDHIRREDGIGRVAMDDVGFAHDTRFTRARWRRHARPPRLATKRNPRCCAPPLTVPKESRPATRQMSPPLRLARDFHRQAEEADETGRVGNVVAFHREIRELW